MLLISVLIQNSIIGQRDQLAYERPAFAYVLILTFDRRKANHVRAPQ